MCGKTIQADWQLIYLFKKKERTKFYILLIRNIFIFFLLTLCFASMYINDYSLTTFMSKYHTNIDLSEV